MKIENYVAYFLFMRKFSKFLFSILTHFDSDFKGEEPYFTPVFFFWGDRFWRLSICKQDCSFTLKEYLLTEPFIWFEGGWPD